MANIDLAIGQVNITSNFLHVRARKVTTPLVVEAFENYPSPLASSFNVLLPSTGDIDPTDYYVDFYESSDGTALDLLLAQFVVNAKNNLIIEETRFYKVNGGGANDPASDQDTLTDTYLDGKTISRVFRDGVGRPLAPEAYLYKEWELVAGGGIKMLNGQLFSDGEIIAIVISYLGDQQTTGSAGLYNGVVTITADTTLTSTHRNKRIRCVGATSRLVVTLEDVTTVPDASFYHFTHNNGNQFQTKIVPVGGQSITYYNTTYTELTIAPGETLRLEKQGSTWEVVLPLEGVLHVGERTAAGWNAHPNTKPEDGTLYDGDDYPRIWYWLSNSLPSTHKVTDDLVIGGGYVHPVGREGEFVVHSTLKKFRVPNTQGWSERGLTSFTTFGADASRTYDYPGGTQPEMIGQHTHALPRDASGAVNIQSLVDSSNSDEGITGASLTGPGSGTENRVKNVGVIYARRF